MADDGHSRQEVSGPAAFWILASLAAAVVAQPSAHRKKDSSFFGGNDDIVRCIPAICIIDAIFDLSTLGSAFSTQFSISKPGQRRRVTPKASATIVKLALTIFAALPQTIKVLSLKGVPATQACAFFFFLATITKLLVDLCGLEPEKPYKAPGEREKETDDSISALLLLAIFFQVPFEFWIWHNFGLSADFDLSAEVEALWSWGTSACILAMGVQLLIWIMYAVVRQHLNISKFPYIIPLRGSYVMMVALGAIKKPVGTRESEASIKSPPSWADSFSRSISQMSCAMLASIAIAKLLDAVGQLILSLLRPKTSEAEAPNTASGESTMDQEQHNDQTETESSATQGTSLRWVGNTGVIADRWVVRALTLHSSSSASMSLTIFNLITTNLYYLVFFDGTETENSSWTSVLG
ncbi:hypothetical protein F53441_241 [Fusarium austroafricanum]|uniref:Uncharacterized protein n=1 Tax=Fusarium austroafricanum TaxID=2364996 RepID=A0A8H4KYS6_9HYPO|nr:hypothetical protein F53441_241 [Fusarium austroafricanum]